MDIVLGDARQFIVDDQRQVVDVESARGDVGGDQHARCAGLEGFECLGALLLGFVAVDGGGVDAHAFQPERQSAGAELGADEDQRLGGG